MAGRHGGDGLGFLILAKAFCCAGVLLLATGVLSGATMSLFEDNLVWLAIPFAIVVAGAALWLRRKRRDDARSGARDYHQARDGAR